MQSGKRLTSKDYFAKHSRTHKNHKNTNVEWLDGKHGVGVPESEPRSRSPGVGVPESDVIKIWKTRSHMENTESDVREKYGKHQAVCAIRPQSSMGAQFTNFARNVNSPSVMGKFSIYFILISSHFDYVLYYYIEKECLVLMCA